MKRMRFSAIAGVIIFAAIFSGCFQNFFGPADIPPPVKTSSGLSGHDYLALLKTQDRHKVNEEELQSIVLNMLNGTSMGRSVGSPGSSITGVKKIALAGDNRFALTGAGRSAAGSLEEEPVELFEFAVGNSSGNEAFVLASNDLRIGAILAMTEGSLEDADADFAKFMKTNLQDYVMASILEYDGITEEDIEAAFEKALLVQKEEGRASGQTYITPNKPSINALSYMTTVTDFQIQKGPLLATQWGQGQVNSYFAYNDYIKYDHQDNSHIAGCGPVAIAQIIAYHNYIKPSSPNRPPAFNTTPYNTISGLGTWTGDWAAVDPFSYIRNLDKITSSSSAAARGQVAALMYQVGKAANANYESGTEPGKSGSTSISNSGAQQAFLAFGYLPSIITNATTVVGTSANFTINHLNNSEYLIPSQLNSNNPIYFSGSGIYYENGVQKSTGHAWVIDGYATMTYCVGIYFNNNAGGTSQINVTLDNGLMVHCNLGWNGNDDGWYVYGIFDTERRDLLDGIYNPNSNVGQGKYNFSTATQYFVPLK
ncbi:MAG: C10 family peptidase [Treponema sp.]|nr:C10 family peptidase [Treponema sp.]